MKFQKLAKQLAKQLADFYEADPARWTQLALARDCKGEPVNFDSPHAVSFCLLGACSKFVQQGMAPAGSTLGLTSYVGSLVKFNDFKNRNVHQVIARLRQLERTL